MHVYCILIENSNGRMHEILFNQMMQISHNIFFNSKKKKKKKKKNLNVYLNADNSI